ncbi:DeoR/GlpR family DNA-binding transcription regulator [Agromyces archimandritae]|uniref:DeoR/GlpR transcriptional regulator n=1 Tax=Agromyces archimandritae TaxID=2781962 RepID=A0A975FKW2_9MICO|nr:DeoR/GlpR family DNA-binding transcription regulator [Agromyces archimandritae]QTX03955.1 DeoR/GlpR transcriptional regulator [Agromyces archimandritae]
MSTDPPSRRAMMVDLIVHRGFASVIELSENFGVTTVTARSDLDSLERDGSVRRVHGGAVPVDAAGRPEREPSFEEALEASVVPKRRIALAAAAMVRSGQSIILDVGTTTHAIARALRERDELDDVTIVTNGLSIALELEAEIPRFTVVVTGGTLRPRQHSLVQPLAGTVLDEVHVDLAFIGCNGVDAAGGVTNANLPEAAVKAHMLRRAARRIVVADGSKLGDVHLGRIGPVEAFDLLITDERASADLIDDLGDAGLEVVRAGDAPNPDALTPDAPSPDVPSESPVPVGAGTSGTP